ncbi:ABC transporter permease [Yinghuangia aomiensis]
MSVPVAAELMIHYELTSPTAIAGCLLVGLLVGCFNATLIVFLRVPPLLATLGTMFTIQGLKRWLVDGQTLTTGMRLNDGTVVKGKIAEDFTSIDSKKLLGMPISVYLFLVIALLMPGLPGAHPLRPGVLRGRRQRGSRPAGGTGCGATSSPPTPSPACSRRSPASSSPSRLRQGDVTAGDSSLLDAVAHDARRLRGPRREEAQCARHLRRCGLHRPDPARPDHARPPVLHAGPHQGAGADLRPPDVLLPASARAATAGPVPWHRLPRPPRRAAPARPAWRFDMAERWC